MVDLDQALAVDASDLALVAARANAALVTEVPNVAFAFNAAPSGLTAPSSVVLAGGFLTQKHTTLGIAIVSLQVTLSGAGSLAIEVQANTGATGITGGAPNGTWQIENGGTPVAFVGGSNVNYSGPFTKTFPTGGLTDVMTFVFPIGAAVGDVVGYQLVATSAVNLSAMLLNIQMLELA